MQIRPAVEIKPFNECAPGELVRFAYRKSHLCFAATHSTGQARYAIRLLDSDGTLRPAYFLRETAEALEEQVISYGHDYRINVDHNDLFEFGSQELTERAAILYLIERDWFLKVPGSKIDHGTGFYNVRTGVLGNAPQQMNPARFAVWNISLGIDCDSEPTVLLQSAAKITPE